MNFVPHYFNSDLFFQFMKSSELAMVFIHLFISLIFGNFKSFFMAIMIVVSAQINYFFKHNLATPLFSFFKDYIPIFGQGSRPIGASDCGYFSNCPPKEAKSFGFPSGHSQFMGIHSGFLIKDIIINKSKDGKFKNLQSKDKFSILFLLILVVLMMYSRVYMEKCHTLEQTIFGSLIGLFLGYKSHDLFTFLNKKYNNILNMDSLTNKIIVSILFFYFTM